jgi:hypothetical protein
VLVYDGRVIRTYVEGQLDKTVAAPGGIATSDARINLGRSGTGKWQFGFRGIIDDLMMWDRALSEVEVMGLWAQLTVLPDGAATRDGT